MSKKEISELEDILTLLKIKYKYSIDSNRILGGFATSSVLNFDNDIIIIEIKFGIGNNGDNSSCRKEIKIDRHSMEIMEKVEI